jgi:hypothetical protein
VGLIVTESTRLRMALAAPSSPSAKSRLMTCSRRSGPLRAALDTLLQVVLLGFNLEVCGLMVGHL